MCKVLTRENHVLCEVSGYPRESDGLLHLTFAFAAQNVVLGKIFRGLTIAGDWGINSAVRTGSPGVMMFEVRVRLEELKGTVILEGQIPSSSSQTMLNLLFARAVGQALEQVLDRYKEISSSQSPPRERVEMSLDEGRVRAVYLPQELLARNRFVRQYG